MFAGAFQAAEVPVDSQRSSRPYGRTSNSGRWAYVERPGRLRLSACMPSLLRAASRLASLISSNAPIAMFPSFALTASTIRGAIRSPTLGTTL